MMDKREDGIDYRRSVMHEVHAALAIMALKRQVGQKGQVSEDEFYAQYGEAPWGRLRRLVGLAQRGLRWRPEARKKPSYRFPS